MTLLGDLPSLETKNPIFLIDKLTTVDSSLFFPFPSSPFPTVTPLSSPLPYSPLVVTSLPTPTGRRLSPWVHTSEGRGKRIPRSGESVDTPPSLGRSSTTDKGSPK